MPAVASCVAETFGLSGFPVVIERRGDAGSVRIRYHWRLPINAARAMIALDGLSALSPFRIDRINADIAQVAPGTRLRAARHVYFVDANADAALDLARLCDVIEAQASAAQTATFWVVPRLGTRSPWSSKATDILIGCGFPVRRIERGIAFDVEHMPEAGSAAWANVTRVLHDPMTQSVVASLAETRKAV